MNLTIIGKKSHQCLVGLIIILSQSGHLAIAQSPISSFTSNVSSGCAPLSVFFINSSSQANQFHWNFGNGNSSTLANPSAVYTAPGIYTVSLAAINTVSNLTDTFKQTITVVPNPASGFSASPLIVCAETNVVSFINTSTNATLFTWDFGDGNSSNAVNPTHIYNTAGIYTVKLIADNGFGCINIYTKTNYITIKAKPVVTFTSNLTSTCNVNTLFNFNCTTTGVSSCSWQFGDGSTSTLLNPGHTYGASGSYTVTLIVTNNFGCTDTLVSPNYINIGPSLVPSIVVNTDKGCAPFNCVFTCSVPNATTWAWNFGDGTTSTQQNPSHLYANPGNYTISLTVTTASGCNGTNTLTNFISVDALPVADFTLVQDTGCLPFTAQFNNTSTGSVSWNWDFGDGTNSTLQNPSHVYNAIGTYTVKLKAYTANGCESIITKTNAVVVQKATTLFNASNNIGCPPLTTTFNSSASTSNIVGWYWTFGDGGTSTLQNPSHVYNTLGIYSVNLKITSASGCVDSLNKYNYVKVVSGVTNYTLPDTIKICMPATLNLVDPTFGSNSWSWNFGDGGTSTVKNPSHTYLSPGIYTVTLSNNMPGGCAQTFNPYAIVQVMSVPLQTIQTISVSNCSPYVVSLANATVNATSFAWDFGDGTTSALQNPNHTYANSGTYTITLTILMQCGCYSTMTQTVVVGHPNPIAVNATKFCLTDPTLFSINNPAAFTSYTWNFGDGNSSAQMNPSHTYTSAGTYNVSVTSTDTSGCLQTYNLTPAIVVSNPIPSFTVTGPTTSCTTLDAVFNNTSTNANGYTWDFGDGTTSTATNPTHTYSTPGVYTVTLTASNNGCTRTSVHTNQIIINSASCNFMYTYSNGCNPVTVNYTDLSPNAVSWAWNFGDGTTSNLQNPVHVFTSAPLSNVKLTIVDVFGCVATKTKLNITIFNANFEASDTLACSNSAITFTDLSTSGVAWHWNFGDGVTSSLQNPTHTYNVTGTYTVFLVVTFPQGCSDTLTIPNYINVSAPHADFTSPTVAGCSPSQINFTNQSSNATNYLWSFGDTTTSTIGTPSHIYSFPGYFTVNLVAYDNFGCTDTMEKVSYIKIPGTLAQFNLSGTTGCEMFSAVFTDQSFNASSWSWNFGDGNISNVQNPTHIYTDSGSFMVTLITQDSLGCTSFYTYPTPVTINPNPDAMAVCSDSSGCHPHQVSFTNTSTGATSYLWVFGDGDTSSLPNPTHLYQTAGLYIPYLVASNTIGCSDTFYLAQGIQVKETPASLFTSNTLSACSPATFALSNQSTNLYFPSYNWSSGNGNASSQATTSFTFTVPGNYNISLVVSNSNGCSDSSGITVTVNDSPVASASTTDTKGCNPYSSTFTNLSTNAINYSWDFGDGGTDTNANPTHIYLLSGTYQVSLIAFNSIGCSDTFNFTVPIIVGESPHVDFTVDHATGCYGTAFALIDLSSGVTSTASYTWTIGSSITSNQQNPVITPASPGLFAVKLLIDNNNGCKDSLSKSPFIQVFDTVAPPVSPIKSVSVTSDTTVAITWSVCTAPDFAAYVLSQLDVTSNSFVPIYVDSNQNNSGISVTSDYTNTGLNTLLNVYTYRLETYDMCGNTVEFNNLIPHSTIDITALPSGKNIQVSWTAYAGCSVDTYEISRKEMPSGPWLAIGTVPSNVLNYLDTSLSCPFNYGYRVAATNLCTEGYTSLSDTSVAAPENKLADQEVKIVRSTVINDKSVLTEWLEPVLYPEQVVLYNIYRSTDSISYSFLAAVPSLNYSYVDNNVDVKKQNYFYKILAVSDCSLESTLFTNSSSVLLKASWTQAKTTLYWTKYRQWDSGVNQYVIEKLDDNGQWVVIKVVDGTINVTSINE